MELAGASSRTSNPTSVRVCPASMHRVMTMVKAGGLGQDKPPTHLVQELKEGCEADGPGADERHYHWQLILGKPYQVAFRQLDLQRQVTLIRGQPERGRVW